jgi:thiosulfate dehydrogenase [quinone] large subunit
MKLSPLQILLLRLIIGALFLSLGIQKYQQGWLTNSSHLVQSLAGFQQHATGLHLTYLDNVAIPHANLWSKLMTIGELAIGISLLLGLLARFSALVGVVMTLNFHAATGILYSLDFFGTPSAALLTVGLLMLFLARAGRWAGADALFAKASSRSILW